MKTRSLLVLWSVFLLAIATAEAGQKPGGGRPARTQEEPASGHASIRVHGNPRASQRVALAKVSFEDAAKAAVLAVPGKIASGELTAEDGNLVYSFTVIAASGGVSEVQIDAGNGKVLAVDDGDDD